MTINFPYTCVRCGYATKEKYRMNDHFFKKKKVCPPIKCDIDLTDEIKNKILVDRIYRLPKLIKTIEFPKRLNKEEEKHYIYFLQPKEYVSKNENVYKIGRSIIKIVDKFSRLEAYGKGANIILTCQCVDSVLLEKEILVEFNSKFSRHEFGNEYFVGDKQKMLNVILTMIMNESNKYTKENNENKENIENKENNEIIKI